MQYFTQVSSQTGTRQQHGQKRTNHGRGTSGTTISGIPLQRQNRRFVKINTEKTVIINNYIIIRNYSGVRKQRSGR